MKRRSFIRGTVFGTMGIALGAYAAELTSCSVRGSNGKIIMALIGCGSRGTEMIISTCKEIPNVELKYVCDIDDIRAGKAIKIINKELGYSPVHVRNMKAVFDDRQVDAVMISTPDHWHALATVRACQAGKDVYVEANPCLTLWEGRKMMEAAKKHKRIVQIGFQHRSAAYCLSAREFIQSGMLGQIVHIKTYNMTCGSKWMPLPDSPVPQGLDWDAWLGAAPQRAYNPGIHDANVRGGWSNFWDFSGGALAQNACHVLDMARMVMGDPGHPTAVYCCGGNWGWDSNQEVPEIQEITYAFDKFTMTCESGNAMAYLKKSPAVIQKGEQQFPDWMRTSNRIEVYGTEGLMYVGCDGAGWQVIGPLEKIIAQENGTKPDKLHLQNFIESLRTRKNPAADVEQGHLSAALVHLGNIAYRVGNKQLLFDGEKEAFVGNDQANNLLKTTYREGYLIPEKV